MQLSATPPIPGFKALAPARALQLANAPAPVPPPDAIDRYIGSHPVTPQQPKTPTAPEAPKAPTSPSAAAPVANAFDLSTDPIVQKIRALNTANYGEAVAGADAARKQTLIGSGFSDLARSAQFGSLENPTTGDEATALAAAQNPFSTAATLAHGHQVAEQGIDQGDNLANLFYSSTRANHLGDEAHNYLGQTSAAEDAVRTALSDVISKLVGVRHTGQLDEANTLETARQNAIADAIASGSKFVGYDANGNPIFDNGTAAPPAGDGTPTPGPDGVLSPAAAWQLANAPVAAPNVGSLLTGLVNPPPSPIAAALKNSAKGNYRAKIA